MISYRFQTTWLDLGVDSIRIVSRIVVSRIKIKRRRFWIQTTICETLWRALTANDENIGNHGYIGNLILRIYRIYRRNIDGYFGKKILIGKKLIKTHKNVKKNLITI